MAYYNFILIQEYTEEDTAQKDWRVEAFADSEKTELLYTSEMTTCGEHLDNPAAVQAEVDGQTLDPLTLDYTVKRAAAYPSIEEQLDMQYHDSVNGTTTWKDAIANVKSSIPKT
tara:strand:+ start:3967 stop:4308 length:342 start_codon:yes stop_codon:yes gene_type:complete